MAGPSAVVQAVAPVVSGQALGLSPRCSDGDMEMVGRAVGRRQVGLVVARAVAEQAMEVGQAVRQVVLVGVGVAHPRHSMVQGVP